MRGRQEHHSMEVEDDCGREYITFWEHQRRQDKEDLTQNVVQFCPKCSLPVLQDVQFNFFKQYLSQRPLELRDKGLFYLAVIENPKTEVWNKKQRLGVNSIDQMMKNIIKNTPLETSSKRLSNHSARKTEINKLRAANIERPVLFRWTATQMKSHWTTMIKELKRNIGSYRSLSAELHRQTLQTVSQETSS